MITIYTISNGDLCQSVLNGIVTLLGSSTMATAIHLSLIFAVAGAVIHFLMRHSVTIFAKWFVLFFIVTVVILGPKTSVQVIDTTDPAGVYEVDNVPSGLAILASTVTSMGTGLAREFDLVFHMPDSETYSKTGMLFGAGLLHRSLGFQLQDGPTKQLLTQYVPNCVVGDIELNGKYTLKQLLDSPDPWTLMADHASPVRGMFVNDPSTGKRQFETCQQAATTITQQLNQTTSVGGTTFNYYANKVFGTPSAQKQQLFAQLFAGANNYFFQGGKTASTLLKNNVVNNAIRSGIRLNASQTNSATSLLNLADTTAFEKMRLSQKVGRDIGTRFIPLMNTVLFLFLVGIFPLIVLLSFQPGLGPSVLKNYAYGFIYLQSWPLLFSLLNFMSTFYLHARLGAIGPAGITLSNSNWVANEHSDVASVAGYFTLAIPFISIYIVKGVASGLSSMSNYIGSSFHSVSGSEASQTVTGNWSMGNMQMDNISANKVDTNQSVRSGMMSQQTESGGTVSFTPAGGEVVHAGLSSLPTSVNFGSAIQSSLQQSMNHSKQAAQVASESSGASFSSSASEMTQLGQQTGHNVSTSEGSDYTQSSNASQALDHVTSATNDYASRHHVSQRQAYNDLMKHGENFGQNVQGSLNYDSGDSLPGKLGSLATGVSVKGSAGLSWGHSNDWSHSSDQGVSSEASGNSSQDVRDAQSFKQGMDYLSSHRGSLGAQLGNSVNTSMLNQAVSHYQKGENFSQQANASLTESQQYADMLSKSQTNSDGYNRNLNNDFVQYVNHHAPAGMANSVLSGSTHHATEAVREQLVDDFVQSRIDSSMTTPVNGSGIDQQYQQNQQKMQGDKAAITENYQANTQKVSAASPLESVASVNQESAHLMASSQQAISQARQQAVSGKEHLSDQGKSIEKQIDGQSSSVKSQINHGEITGNKKENSPPEKPSIRDLMKDLE